MGQRVRIKNTRVVEHRSAGLGAFLCSDRVNASGLAAARGAMEAGREGLEVDLLLDIVEWLAQEVLLEPKHTDHSLTGSHCSS